MMPDDLRVAFVTFINGPYAAWLVLACLGAALVGLAAWMARTSSRQRELRRILSEAWNDVSELRRTADALAQDQALSRARLDKLAEELESVTKQQEQLMLLSADAGPYVQAIRHAQRGATVAELVSTHGLGEAEAALIVALHARGTDPA
jgi:hypothetical protein